MVTSWRMCLIVRYGRPFCRGGEPAATVRCLIEQLPGQRVVVVVATVNAHDAYPNQLRTG